MSAEPAASWPSKPSHHRARPASELAAARDRLALMHAENLSVAAVLNLSYRDNVKRFFASRKP